MRERSESRDIGGGTKCTIDDVDKFEDIMYGALRSY
jgi:hypothetical protein